MRSRPPPEGRRSRHGFLRLETGVVGSFLPAPGLGSRAGWGVLVCALPVLLAGCSPEDGRRSWTTAIDTLPNGAVHVVNTPPAREIPTTWTIEEELRIGTVEGGRPGSFGQVRGLAVTGDGRIAVLDAQAQEVRLFGPDGTHLRTFGGRGAGPGELEGGYGLMLGPEGRLWVPDHRNARMSLFDPDTGFVESYALRVLSRGFTWSGVIADDRRILKPSISLVPERRDLFRVYDLEMNLVDSIFRPERPEVDPEDPPGSYYWESSDGGMRGYFPVPFYPGTPMVLDPAGAVWSTPAGDPAYRIGRRIPGGDTTLVIETRRPAVPVTAAERDSAIDRVRSHLLERGARSAKKDWSRVPDRKPSVVWMFVAEDGRLWVEATTPNTLRTYDVYERDGRLAGTAVGSLDIWRAIDPVIRGDRLWAVVRDELDVPYVVKARLMGGGGGA